MYLTFKFLYDQRCLLIAAYIVGLCQVPPITLTDSISQDSTFVNRVKKMSLCDSPLIWFQMFRKNGLVCSTHGLQFASSEVTWELDQRLPLNMNPVNTPRFVKSQAAKAAGSLAAGSPRSALNFGQDINNKGKPISQWTDEWVQKKTSLISITMPSICVCCRESECSHVKCLQEQHQWISRFAKLRNAIFTFDNVYLQKQIYNYTILSIHHCQCHPIAHQPYGTQLYHLAPS